MQALLFPTLAAAEARSQAQALAVSAGDQPGDQTRLWWAVAETLDGPAVLVPPGMQAGLTPAEIALLVPARMPQP